MIHPRNRRPRRRLKDYLNLAGLLKRLHDRPAYQRAIEKGGPLELMRR
jgi:hypothetical protein